MNKFKKFLNIFTLILLIFNFKVFVQADDDKRIERIESQVQDALIKIKAIAIRVPEFQGDEKVLPAGQFFHNISQSFQ